MDDKLLFQLYKQRKITLRQFLRFPSNSYVEHRIPSFLFFHKLEKEREGVVFSFVCFLL